MEKKEDLPNIDFISTSGVYKTPFTIIIFIQLCVGGLVLLIVNLWFINSLYFLLFGNEFYNSGVEAQWYFWFLVPLNIYGNMFLFSFSIILFSAAFFKLLNILHPPIEGTFERGSKEWKYTHRRFWVAYFPIWIARALPIPWFDVFVYRLFGVRIGKSVVTYEGYIDPELVEIGDFTMTSLHIGVFSHLIYHDKVIIKRIKIGKSCIVGPHTILTPGTVLQDGAILGANSYTSLNQTLESNLIHIGKPVSKSFPIQSLEDSIEKAERIKKIDQSIQPTKED